MFSSGPNYTKLKTHLRLAVNRLKLLEKKKAELTQKARKEIADYISIGKPERARIRVEHIIREDFLIEAMEILEMYCDLLLARFGLVTQMKELDEGIAEAVATVIWAAPRLVSDIQELKIIAELFTTKYGKPFAEAARSATGDHKVSEKLMHKLAIQAPPKLLVEKYLIEIAKMYKIEYEPDPQIMKDENKGIGLDSFLIDLSDKNNLNGGGGGSDGVPMFGFLGYPQPPPLPNMPLPPNNMPFSYPQGPSGGFGNSGGNFGSGGFGNSDGNFGSGFGNSASAPVPFNYNIPPNAFQQPEQKDLNINADFIEDQKRFPPAYSSLSPDDNLQNSLKPKPQPRSKLTPDMDNTQDFPVLPSVPSDFPEIPKDKDDIDFDDLSRRFEELKKKK